MASAVWTGGGGASVYPAYLGGAPLQPQQWWAPAHQMSWWQPNTADGSCSPSDPTSPQFPAGQSAVNQMAYSFGGPLPQAMPERWVFGGGGESLTAASGSVGGVGASGSRVQSVDAGVWPTPRRGAETGQDMQIIRSNALQQELQAQNQQQMTEFHRAQVNYLIRKRQQQAQMTGVSSQLQQQGQSHVFNQCSPHAVQQQPFNAQQKQQRKSGSPQAMQQARAQRMRQSPSEIMQQFQQHGISRSSPQVIQPSQQQFQMSQSSPQVVQQSQQLPTSQPFQQVVQQAQFQYQMSRSPPQMSRRAQQQKSSRRRPVSQTSPPTVPQAHLNPYIQRLVSNADQHRQNSAAHSQTLEQQPQASSHGLPLQGSAAFSQHPLTSPSQSFQQPTVLGRRPETVSPLSQGPKPASKKQRPKKERTSRKQAPSQSTDLAQKGELGSVECQERLLAGPMEGVVRRPKVGRSPSETLGGAAQCDDTPAPSVTSASGTAEKRARSRTASEPSVKRFSFDDDNDVPCGPVCATCMREFDSVRKLRLHEDACRLQLERCGLLPPLVPPRVSTDLPPTLALGSLSDNSHLPDSLLLPPGQCTASIRHATNERSL